MSLLVRGRGHSRVKIFYLVFVSLLLHVTSKQAPKTYVVYMGSPTRGEDVEDAEENHIKLLSSIISSEERARLTLVHTYGNLIKGFAALLTENEAEILSNQDGIVSVFPDPVLKLHTTRSWDFLVEESDITTTMKSFPITGDVIIGMVDTGVWPESRSFNDAGLRPIPSRWKGECMEGPDFKKSNCNRKLIGARYYNSLPGGESPDSDQAIGATGSPRDTIGHGTHTASTAAGSLVHNASYFGLGLGTAKGGSPTSRLAVYKACSVQGCSGADILKAMDDAVADGVDIISISIGISSIFQTDFLSDPIAIGAFHATQKGVLVVCSAGNDGPFAYSVINSAPWIFTIGASTIDRAFETSLMLGDGRVFQASGINFSNLTSSVLYPLVYAGDIPSDFSPPEEARNCYPGSLNASKAKGKIVVCADDDASVTRRVKKLVTESTGAKGLIYVYEDDRSSAFDSGDFPFAEVNNSVGLEILAYINSTKMPKATILPSFGVNKVKPAPVVAYFSSRGPGGLTENILKPDIIAPGVNILAAVTPINMTSTVPKWGKRPSLFAIKSGTSMACPHGSGAAAFVKSVHPHWTSSMIKSALMTTAITMNNQGKHLTNTSGITATPLDEGSGELSPIRALNPGLVYETPLEDYFKFLCYYGYKDPQIRSISGNGFLCPNMSNPDLISNINYPSISISNMVGINGSRTVRRVVTNVGPKSDVVYSAKVEAPLGLEVEVLPNTLRFSRKETRLAFDVQFSAKGGLTGYVFGSLTWSDGWHDVRSPFVVNLISLG